MNKNLRYVLIGLGIIIAGVAFWYFKNIVAYILIAAILSLIGRPVVNFLKKLHIKKFRLPKALCALLTLILIWGILFTFIRIFVPVVFNEANQLADADIKPLLTELEEPLSRIENLFYELNPDLKDVAFQDYIAEKLANVVNVNLLTNIFSVIAGILGNVFFAIFAISFITFFFLKDESLFSNGMLALVPTKFEDEVKHAFERIRKLLTRYFLGICLQVTGIITLVTIGMTIIGVGFKHGLVIGLFAGLMNVIPYLGPIIGSTVGILMGAAAHIDLPLYEKLLPLIGLMVLVFVIVQVIDNILFQPIIFGNSVYAHPLEVFLVILIAGTLAGIPGMVLAIPTYTIIRVFAKEFFYNLKIVQKLTTKI